MGPGGKRRVGIQADLFLFPAWSYQEGAEEYCVAHAALFDVAAAALLAAEKGAEGEDSPAGKHKVSGHMAETAVNGSLLFVMFIPTVMLVPISVTLAIEVTLQPRLPPAGLYG
jgi:hypothetical protein